MQQEKDWDKNHWQISCTNGKRQLSNSSRQKCMD